jgi:hypothetical protein
MARFEVIRSLPAASIFRANAEFLPNNTPSYNKVFFNSTRHLAGTKPILFTYTYIKT